MPVGLEITQAVVPKQFKSKLLTVAHEYSTSGYLGAKKTKDRLTRHFFYLVGVGKFVRQVCRSCDACQRLGKGSSPQRTPLINQPVINNDPRSQ